MRSLFTLLLVVLLTSCNENKKTSDNQDQPFFLFDQVDYYHVNLSKKELQAIQLKQEKTRKEEALLQILAGNIPVSIKDTLFIKNMEILEFEKDTIDPKLNPSLAHLFSFREVAKPITAGCNSSYRDILIFRNKSKIIGMAKVSFDCHSHQMIGERYNDSNFGQSGEYTALEKILNRYKP